MSILKKVKKEVLGFSVTTSDFICFETFNKESLLKILDIGKDIELCIDLNEDNIGKLKDFFDNILQEYYENRGIDNIITELPSEQ